MRRSAAGGVAARPSESTDPINAAFFGLAFTAALSPKLLGPADNRMLPKSSQPQPSEELELVRSIVDLPRVEHVAACRRWSRRLWSCRLHISPHLRPRLGCTLRTSSEPQGAQHAALESRADTPGPFSGGGGVQRSRVDPRGRLMGCRSRPRRLSGCSWELRPPCGAARALRCQGCGHGRRARREPC
jgi:hypothetical protein